MTVLIFGIDRVLEQPKRFAFEVHRRVFPASPVHCVGRSVIDKVSRPVGTPTAVLVSNHRRLSRSELDEVSAVFGAVESHVMLDHKIWAEPSDEFEVVDVAPNVHRLLMDAEHQVVYDAAVMDGFRSKLCKHHPNDVYDWYRARGFEVVGGEVPRATDQSPLPYSARIRVGESMDHRGLRSMGRHALFSGLWVPC